MEIKFIHKISKGSRFNQIYVPKEAESEFEAGDLVEVKLLQKKVQLYYSKNLPKISEFKEKLIRDIFIFLSEFKEIEQVFVFGSFLTKEIDYNDIDLLIISDKSKEDKIYQRLIKIFNLKFHVISVDKEKLEKALENCPLTRSMLYYFVSNKPFAIKKDTRIDKNHIKFLMMFPEDLLRVSLDYGLAYYDSLRKLIVIENFLKKQEIPPNLIDKELEKLIDKRKLEFLKKNRILDKKIQEEIKIIIKEKINLIYRTLKNGKKRQHK